MRHHEGVLGQLGAALFTLCLVTGFVILAPVASHAIPSPGDYAFTSGLIGSFHVEGTGSAGHLTAWEIDDPTNSAIHWSNTKLFPTGLQIEVTNDTSTFQTNEFGHYFFTLNWLTGQWTDYSSVDQKTYVGDFTYEGRTAVPEPGTASLLALGLLALTGYRWRQRTRTGVGSLFLHGIATISVEDPHATPSTSCCRRSRLSCAEPSRWATPAL